MACPGSFPSCHEENDPDPKLGRDLHPDNGKIYVMSGRCHRPSIFAHFFLVFVPNSMTFSTDPRVVESVTGLVPVEHPRNI